MSKIFKEPSQLHVRTWYPPRRIDTKLIIKFAIFACICDFLAFLDSLHIINLDERRLIRLVTENDDYS